MGQFTIKMGKDKQVYFNLRANNHEIILSSEGYKSQQSCLIGINAVKANAMDDSKYSKLISKNNEYYFTLKAANNEIIGTSEMYGSSSQRDSGIASVKANAPTAEIVEE